MEFIKAMVAWFKAMTGAGASRVKRIWRSTRQLVWVLEDAYAYSVDGEAPRFLDPSLVQGWMSFGEFADLFGDLVPPDQHRRLERDLQVLHDGGRKVPLTEDAERIGAPVVFVFEREGMYWATATQRVSRNRFVLRGEYFFGTHGTSYRYLHEGTGLQWHDFRYDEDNLPVRLS